MRLYSLALIVAGGVSLGGTAAAQITVRTRDAGYERGCRGHTIELQIDRFTRVPAAYPVVAAVEAGSPSARAGMQVGDSLVSQDGVDFTAGVPPRRYAVGDTIRLVVRRGGRNHPLLLVLGRAPVPGDSASGAVCRPAARRE
ncbi:MAG: hypothetical protein ICV87_06045 [Gemmatimonadetes bacterium]|nr:hypothetical protein [Gemmatimonadota bacterium]